MCGLLGRYQHLGGTIACHFRVAGSSKMVVLNLLYYIASHYKGNTVLIFVALRTASECECLCDKWN
jgi:hypothetical protein